MPAHIEQSLIKIIEQIYRDTHCPARTVAVATRYGYSERWTRQYLSRLVRNGRVQRVGQRGGYMPLAV
jgi:DNA-binding GntR family transcriptional regulator